MSTIINATTTNGVVIQPDNSGSLVLQTNSGTTALTIDTSQNVRIGPTSTSGKFNVSHSNQITDAYGIVNIYSTDAAATNKGASIGLGGATGQATANFLFGTIAGRYEGSGYSGYLQFSTTASNGLIAERMRIDSSGGLILAGSTAQKATGTTWSNPSDQRLKDNIRDYTKGTTELMQVRVREWEYNGKGGTTEGMKGLGVIADEVMTVLPNTVETYDAKLNTNDENNTAIKKFDATEITWLLVKTVQEQQTIINDLKARIETLEAK